MRLSSIVLVVVSLTVFSCTDSGTSVDPTPDLPEIDSVVISQPRGSDTIDVVVVKQNTAGSTRSSIYDSGDDTHSSVVTFSSKVFTSGEVMVVIYGKQKSPFETPLVVKRYSFTPAKANVTDTITGTIGSIAVVSGSGTTCSMTGKIILKP